MDYEISLDTTAPVKAGIEEILITLAEAIGLVVLVVFIFLQSWRATLIPLLTVPVSLVGVFILFPVPRLLDQHAVAVRAGAGHRPRGRRRHRRRGGGRAPHRGRIVAARGDLQGDVRGDGAGHRHRPDPGRGVRPGGVHGRNHGPPVPAVRAHHRRLGFDFGLQRADPQPGAGGDAAAPSGRIEGRHRATGTRVQPAVRARHPRVCPNELTPRAQAGHSAGAAGRRGRCFGRHWAQAAVGLSSRRGQRLCPHRRAAARRGIIAADQGGVQEGRGDSRQHRRDPHLQHHRRLQLFHALGRQLRGHRVHRFQAVGRPRSPRPDRQGDRRQAQRAVFEDSRGARLRLAAAGHSRHQRRRWVQHVHPGSQRRVGAVPGRERQAVRRRRPQAPRAAEREPELLAVGAADLRRGRQGEGVEAGGADRGRLRGPAGVHGRRLRQRLHPVLSAVEGVRAGRYRPTGAAPTI